VERPEPGTIAANGEDSEATGRGSILRVDGDTALAALAPLPSPKLSKTEKRLSIYPYYAGFSETFATAMLDRLGVAEGLTVLDPWNGSGTTTYLAALRGARSIGCDLNPALGVVARARAAAVDDVASAYAANDVLAKLGPRPDAPALEHCLAIYEAICSDLKYSNRLLTSAAEAIILCALFNALRSNYGHAKTKNPTWFSSCTMETKHLPFTEIQSAVSITLLMLLNRQRRTAPFIRCSPELYTSDFLSWPAPSASIDVVLTSPPYLTRLDYVKATLPELLFLSRIQAIDLREMRTKMMGSPLVGHEAPSQDPTWGLTAAVLLEAISRHPSKASSTYYLRFFQKYFAALQAALKKISASLRKGGKACLVVQASHYKEIYINLPAIVVDMSEVLHFELVQRVDFMPSRSIVAINRRAAKITTLTAESAIILERKDTVSK
jgi:SAM-dependent methyltransferase